MDTDEHVLFQALKNESYKKKIPTPKVYLYTGFEKKCFIFQSRSEWTIVLERSLLAVLNDAQKREFAGFVYLFKDTNMALVQTKVMGVCTLLFVSLQILLRRFFFLKPKSGVFKVLYVFLLGLIRPLILPIELLGKKTQPIRVGLDLKSIYNQLSFSSHGLNDYISLQVLSDVSHGELMIGYLEGFPVLENCRFDESEF